MNEIKLDNKSKLFFLLLLGGVIASVYAIYQMAIVRQDFEVFHPESGIPDGVPETSPSKQL